MARGYSLDGLANVILPSFQDSLNVNLNTLVGRDSEGKYMQPSTANATAANNYPIQEAGMLEVLRHAGNNTNNVIQRYTSFSSRRLFIRSQIDSSGTWSGWDEYARMSEIYKQVYPVGAIYACVNSVNPNTLFPGTTWTQITDGRSLRSSTNNTVGTASGNIGETGGSDSVSIAVGHLPSHSHTIAHTHDAPQHTHAFPAHVHTMAHTHSVPAHSHTASGSTGSAGAHTHSVSGTAASAGNHDHAQRAWRSSGGGSSTYIDRNVFNNAGSTDTSSRTEAGGAHTHTVSGTAASAGAHTHTVSVTVNQQAAMTTGGVSTANTGSTGGTTGNASALTTGGPSVASSGNTGSGTALSVANTFRRVAVWQRTA